MKPTSLLSFASSLLIGLMTAGMTASVVPQTAFASDPPIEAAQEQPFDQPLTQVTAEPSTTPTPPNADSPQPTATPDWLQIAPGTPAIAISVPPPESGIAATPTATGPATDVVAPATTKEETPLVSMDTPVVAIEALQQQPEQAPVTVFVPTATVRTRGSSAVLEITPERRTLTLQPSDTDRVAAWRQELQNALIQPVVTARYQGMPVPVAGNSSRFTVKPGVRQVAAAHFDRHYLDTLFPVPMLPTPAVPSTGSLVYPLSQVAPVTSPFGWRKHPIYGSARFHAGIDLGAPYGTPVLATFAGQVVAVGNAGGYGLRIVVQHGDQMQTLYAHLSQAIVNVGDVVQAGQAIGRVGASGNVTGPHLHLELQQLTAAGWQAVDFRSQLYTAEANFHSGARVGAVPLVPMAQPVDPTAPIVRVALGQRLQTVRLAASTPAWVLDTQQRPIAILPGMQSLIATRTTKGIKVGTSTFPTVFFIQPSHNGAVAVGNRWYRGKLLVAALPTGLVVVNWVDIESYLYSVVGGEAYPSWGQEALKAQAIAARTYALKIRNEEPASAWFDLDDSPRYQRYRGIETEFPTTIQAVTATNRQILVDARYGNLILSQYAATQDLVNAVHRGYGLSQWGAASLARRGFEYHHILHHYYPGTLLTVLGHQ